MRRALLIVGLLTLAGAWLGPLAQLARSAFFARMVMHMGVVWAWHTPALHHAARHGTAGLMIEQGMFLRTGLLMWLSAFGGEARRGGNRRAAGVVGLLLTSMHMTLLGALLALTPRPLYHQAEGLIRLTPLDDQHLGGVLMLLAGGVSYLLGGLWLTAKLRRGAALEPWEAV